jgi:hypothetical protein
VPTGLEKLKIKTNDLQQRAWMRFLQEQSLQQANMEAIMARAIPADLQDFLGHGDAGLALHQDESAGGDGGGTVVGAEGKGDEEGRDGQEKESAHARFLHTWRGMIDLFPEFRHT